MPYSHIHQSARYDPTAAVLRVLQSASCPAAPQILVKLKSLFHKQKVPLGTLDEMNKKWGVKRSSGPSEPIKATEGEDGADQDETEAFTAKSRNMVTVLRLKPEHSQLEDTALEVGSTPPQSVTELQHFEENTAPMKAPKAEPSTPSRSAKSSSLASSIQASKSGGKMRSPKRAGTKSATPKAAQSAKSGSIKVRSSKTQSKRMKLGDRKLLARIVLEKGDAATKENVLEAFKAKVKAYPDSEVSS